jgi:hypothetical protein
MKRKKALIKGIADIFYNQKRTTQKINGKNTRINLITGIKEIPDQKLDLLFS